ncbi:MAG: hypothetical protein GF347_04240 [Candidatus Moranbacteria bacterium]|nr:hypothetical protein [Candidatus Moranbacteria bacterium]
MTTKNNAIEKILEYQDKIKIARKWLNDHNFELLLIKDSNDYCFTFNHLKVYDLNILNDMQEEFKTRLIKYQVKCIQEYLLHFWANIPCNKTFSDMVKYLYGINKEIKLHKETLDYISRNYQ